jgi:sarcosine oxidase subunit beta
LAKEHGLTNIAVLEKGWIGGGNTGRNTTIIRSNYLFNESAALYDHSLKMWENLSQELNYNVMFSPRGVMMLAHTVHDIQVFKRHVHANRCNGVDNEWLTRAGQGSSARCSTSSDIRYPVLGAALQRRGGTARHDAVAWGFARAADSLGVDIIENCEVTGIRATRVAPSKASRPRAADRRQGSASRRRQYQRGPEHGRCAPAARKLSAAGAGLRAGQSRCSPAW